MIPLEGFYDDDYDVSKVEAHLQYIRRMLQKQADDYLEEQGIEVDVYVNIDVL